MSRATPNIEDKTLSDMRSMIAESISSSSSTIHTSHMDSTPPKSAAGEGGMQEKSPGERLDDVEKQAGPSSSPRDSGGRAGAKANQNEGEKGGGRWTVNWDGEDDPADPLNTPGWRKWCALVVFWVGIGEEPDHKLQGDDHYIGGRMRLCDML